MIVHFNKSSIAREMSGRIYGPCKLNKPARNPQIHRQHVVLCDAVCCDFGLSGSDLETAAMDVDAAPALITKKKKEKKAKKEKKEKKEKKCVGLSLQSWDWRAPAQGSSVDIECCRHQPHRLHAAHIPKPGRRHSDT
jgi:hypothetical protein